MKICPHCSAEQFDNNKICTRCGQSLKDAQRIQTDDQASYSHPEIRSSDSVSLMKKEDGKRSGSPMKFVLILSAVLVIAAGTAGYFLHRSSEDVNRTAVTAANNTAEQSFEKAEEESSVMPETSCLQKDTRNVP